MEAQEAYTIIKKQNEGLSLVECVDLGDRYGFVFVAWDEKVDGNLTRDKVYKIFLISGWSTVDKETGKIDELNSYYYLEAHPEMNGKIEQLPINR